LGGGKAVVLEGDPFGGEQAEFFSQSRACGAAKKSAGREIRGDDPVAGDFGGKGIGAEGLTDGAGRAAADAATQGSVGDDAAGRNFSQRGVDAEGEGGEGGWGFQWFSVW
jgi:hypothetical protein